MRTRKMPRFLRTAMAGALAASLCVTMGATSLADYQEYLPAGENGPASGGYLAGTPEAPADASITKVIQMPEGTTTPEGNAVFTFTKVSVDGNTDETSLNTLMPTVADVNIAFATTDTGTTAEGVKKVTLESGTLFDGVEWTHTGTYIYTVKEEQDTFVLTNNADIKEDMEYSTAEYQVTAVVAQAEDGTYYLKYVAVKIIVTDTTGEAGDKVDPTHGVDVQGNGFRFTNTFMRTEIGKPGTDDDNANLFIGKTVTGDMGDINQYFEFTATLTNPAVSTNSLPQSYTAYITDADGIVVDPSDNGITGADGEGKFTITPAQATEFKLKHGQKLVIVDLPVGASYTAAETNAHTHTASSKKVANGAEPVEGENGTIASTLIGEGANSATVINNKVSTPPTGILINNLPYISLILLAGAAFVGFVFKKSHRTAR